MANVTLTEKQAEAIQIALKEADKVLAGLERLSRTGRPIRRDDIQFPSLRTALNEALAVEMKPAKAAK